MSTIEQLKTQANKSALFRKHTIDWQTEKSDYAFGVCPVCGMSVTCRTNPLPNQIDVGGALVALDCGDECCIHCGKYASQYARDDKNNHICYSCCAILDQKHMNIHNKVTLYLTLISNFAVHWDDIWSQGKVTNWPGTLEFKCHVKRGKHNIANYRYDVWFKDHSGNNWWGVCYGDNTQLVHCKKVKAR